ncbi:MAG: hypothetical protein HN353_02295 [Bdellovibrionales bacterium]|jgi:F0F1-type ATP synthase membrane subunit b/b'|nr:hypothetical protein [Bdellovibrionales bacterium]MBT3525516.1 hypothetical protein [Bdellovibrionales bacterium]MBT7667951.1 hypothetical protein [Bdellovibrionales bacterium]MBT7765596.1 hypothetical protein [Bdellovibrionales bacterium]
MKILQFIFLVSLVSIVTMMSALASSSAEGAHHPSPMDLIFPAINLTILLSLLFWKLKKPIVSYFTDNAKSVEEQVKHAAAKGKEAQHRFDQFQSKIESIADVKKQVIQEEETEISRFQQRVKLEREQLVERMTSDTDSRIESDRVNLEHAAQQELVDNVIAKAKDIITSDLSRQEKASEKLISKLV